MIRKLVFAVSCFVSTLTYAQGVDRKLQLKQLAPSIATDTLSCFDYMTSAQIADVQTGSPTLDETVAINAALAAAAATIPPSKLYCPTGVYGLAGTLNINTGVAFHGAGQGSTVFKRLPGAAVTMLQTYQYSTLAGTNTPVGPYKFGLYDMDFNGNRWLVTGVADNITLYGYDYDIKNVDSYGATGRGFVSQWATSGTVPVVAGGDGMEARIDSIKTFSNAGVGFSFAGPHDSQISKLVSFINGSNGIIIADGTTYSSGGTALTDIHAYYNGGPLYISAASVHVHNVQSESNPSSSGMQVDVAGSITGSDIAIWNNLGATSAGLILLGSNSNISNIYASGNGSNGIYVSGSNNLLTSVNTPSNLNYGVAISGNNNILQGAQALSNTTGGYNITGTGNHVTGNY